ncbi:TolC family protein [Verrucomicrobiota bacterium sgz303538]
MTFPACFACLAALVLPFSAVLAGEDVVSRPGILHLTLDSAIRMALSKNFSIQVEQLSPQAARERVTSALGRFDPLFDITAGRDESATRDSFTAGQHAERNLVTRTDRFGIGLGGITPFGTTYDFGLGARNNTGSLNAFDEDLTSEASVSLRQPLLRGFGTDVNLAQVRIARTNVQSSEWQLRSQIIDVIRNIEYAFNDLYTAHENLRVAESSQQLARQTMEDNMKRAAIGVMTPLNITTARAEVASREEAVILARRNVLDTENTIKQLVTNDLARMLSIRVEIEPPPTLRMRPDVTAGIGDALALRPDYRQSLLEIQRRNIAVAVQKNQALPQLDLVGSLNLLGFDNDLGTSLGRIASRDASAWSAGAVFSIPIGNRTARGNLNAAKIEAAQSLVRLQQLEQEIIVQVDNAAGQITTNRERIESTSEARKLAKESLEAGEERLRAGTGTTFEVLELQRRLAEAELAELRARSDYNKAVAEYFRQTGTTLRERRVVVQ